MEPDELGRILASLIERGLVQTFRGDDGELYYVRTPEKADDERDDDIGREEK